MDINKRIIDYLANKISNKYSDTYKVIGGSTVHTTPKSYTSRFKCGPRGSAFNIEVNSEQVIIRDFTYYPELAIDIDDGELVDKVIDFIDRRKNAVPVRY